MIRSIIAKWYAKRTCVYCGKSIQESDWLEQTPFSWDLTGRQSNGSRYAQKRCLKC
jgi:hypothetical protein